MAVDKREDEDCLPGAHVSTHTSLLISMRLRWMRKGCCTPRGCQPGPAPVAGALAGTLPSAVSCGSRLANGAAALWITARANKATISASSTPRRRGRRAGLAGRAPAGALASMGRIRM